MRKLIKLTETDLNNIIKRIVRESDFSDSQSMESNSQRYMFFSNLEQIKRQAELLLDLDENEIEKILENGHDWAQDHIATSKESIDQVFDFLMNETKRDDSFVTENVLNEKQKKNVPTNPKLWKQCLNWAKSRYEVCPSAYCNGAAAKRYKEKGGKWKKS
jgi:hypothetical protein